MYLTDFKDVAQGIQSITVAAAVVAGGIWALYRFWSLRELEKAKVELRKAMAERGTVNISLTARPLSRPNGDGYYIELTASVINVGNRTEVLNWEQGGVYTGQVVAQEKGDVVLGDVIETKLLDYKGGTRLAATLAPAENQAYHFLIPIDNPGIFYVFFTVLGTPQEMEEAKTQAKLSKEQSYDIEWAAETFVVVGGPEQNGNNSDA